MTADYSAHSPMARRPRVLVVMGTRPEAIKLAPVVLTLRVFEDEVETLLCSTGQHRELLEQALQVFSLKPDVDLHLMQPGQTLPDLAARAISALDDVIHRTNPDIILVQGDTTSALVGALVGYYNRIPVWHVEAGLRSGDLYQPFPEEGNRRLISSLTALHFAPTPHAARNLRHEGIPAERIIVTGNTVIDALLYVRSARRANGHHAHNPDRRLILLTMHRRESFGGPLEDVCKAVQSLVERNHDIEVNFPVHPSPSVRGPVEQCLGDHERIYLHDPVDYPTMVELMDRSYLVLTDSGGIQEEAPSLGKPVLVLRAKTERPEAVRAGTSRLIGTDKRRVLRETERLLHDRTAYESMAHAENPYGDGRAAARITDTLRFHFGLAAKPPTHFQPAYSSPKSRPIGVPR